jgi:hypothetical protein
MRAVAQARARPSRSPVVDALVISAPTSPVSQYPIRSGMSGSVRAAASCGVFRAATSW